MWGDEQVLILTVAMKLRGMHVKKTSRLRALTVKGI